MAAPVALRQLEGAPSALGWPNHPTREWRWHPALAQGIRPAPSAAASSSDRLVWELAAGLWQFPHNHLLKLWANHSPSSAMPATAAATAIIAIHHPVGIRSGPASVHASFRP